MGGVMQSRTFRWGNSRTIEYARDAPEFRVTRACVAQ